MEFHSSQSILIEKSPAEVFKFVADFVNNDKKWWPKVSDQKQLKGHKAEEGAVFSEESEVMGQRFPLTLKIVESQAPTSLKFESKGGLVPFLEHYVLKEVAEGTEFTMNSVVTITGWFRLLGPLFPIMLNRETSSNLHRLKQVLEAGK